MAETEHQQGLTPTSGGQLLSRPVIFWALAAASLAAFLMNEYRGFLSLSDLGSLDADDAMRVQEVRDLVAGQAWFDMRQHRYGPPDGTLMHWSRLVDAPIAAGIWLLAPLAGATLAERIAITAWPVLLLLVYFALLVGGVRRAFNTRAAALAVVVTVNLIAFRDLFGAGAIDHHNVQVVLTLASALAFAFTPSRPALAAAAGIAAGLSLAVGLESLPFVAGIGVLFVLAWILDPAQSRALESFTAALALTSLVAFGVQTSPARWLAPACDTLSAPWLLLSCGSWLLALIFTNAGPLPSTRGGRLAGALIGGGALAALLIVLFPVCLEGPYHAVPAAVRPTWLELTGEALSLPEMFRDFPERGAVVFGPTIAATIAAWIGVARSAGQARRLLLTCAALLTLTLALSLFQIRAIYLGVALTPLVGGWALDRILASATASSARLARGAAYVMAGALFFELPWLVGASVAERLGARPAIAIHDPKEMRACLHDAAELETLPKGVILAPIDLGAHVLLMTGQPIIAAGYHRNVEGIVAGLTAFSGGEEELREVVDRDHADYVVLCLPWIDAYPARYGSFAEALAHGNAIVPWLEPIRLKSTKLKVWRVPHSDVAGAQRSRATRQTLSHAAGAS